MNHAPINTSFPWSVPKALNGVAPVISHGAKDPIKQIIPEIPKIDSKRMFLRETILNTYIFAFGI